MRIQSAPRALESAPGLVTNPPGALIDEAQEMSPDVLCELRILSSADFDATSLLTVVLSGTADSPDLLRQDDLVPLGPGFARGLSPSPPRARNSWSCCSTR